MSLTKAWKETCRRQRVDLRVLRNANGKLAQAQFDVREALEKLRDYILLDLDDAEECASCATVEIRPCAGHLTVATLNLLLDKGDPASDVMFMPGDLLAAIKAVVPQVVARGTYEVASP